MENVCTILDLKDVIILKVKKSSLCFKSLLQMKAIGFIGGWGIHPEHGWQTLLQ